MIQRSFFAKILFVEALLFLQSYACAELLASYKYNPHIIVLLKNFSVLLFPVFISSLLFIFVPKSLFRPWLLLTVLWLAPFLYFSTFTWSSQPTALSVHDLLYIILSAIYLLPALVLLMGSSLCTRAVDAYLVALFSITFAWGFAVFAMEYSFASIFFITNFIIPLCGFALTAWFLRSIERALLRTILLIPVAVYITLQHSFFEGFLSRNSSLVFSSMGLIFIYMLVLHMARAHLNVRSILLGLLKAILRTVLLIFPVLFLMTLLTLDPPHLF